VTNASYLLRAPTQGRLTEQPMVSLCIPTKNRARTIRACLESIRAQQYPSLEIIVVDNQSTDETPTIAAQYADHMLSSPGPLGLVRQTSIDAARGEILGIIDDDIVMPDPQWLSRAVRLFDANELISTVWPRLIAPPSSGAITRCFFALNQAIFEDRMVSNRGVFGGGNSLFRTRAVEAVGGFDVTADFGEDMILAGRLKRAGYCVAYSPDPLIHDSMYSLREIYRKQRWGAQAVRASGWDLMEQPLSSLLREQMLVGGRAFLRGLIRDRDSAWWAFPVVLAVKAAAYGSVALHRTRPAVVDT
jgi:glycosyltransferase involved in cell wall biosynthesis